MLANWGGFGIRGVIQLKGKVALEKK